VFNNLILHISQIIRSIPAFVVSFPVFLGDLCAKKQVWLSTKVVGSLRFSGLPKMHHYFMKLSDMQSSIPTERDWKAVIACSDCFIDHGLRQTAFDKGQVLSDACPTCKSMNGRKLNRSTLFEACRAFFVEGSVPTGSGVFAPMIQVNSCHGTSDRFGTVELNSDIQLLECQHGLYCFQYGHPMWMFGKTGDEDGNVEWSITDIEYIIDHCRECFLAPGETVYHVQLGLQENEIIPERFCSPPDEFRKKFWRFDSEDVPICYTAFDVETCLHESRVTLQHDIFVAVLEARQTLRMLDLSACQGPSDITRFEDPYIWLLSLLYGGDERYDVCRRLAHRIRERGYDGFIYTSFFQQAAERPHKNVALFGTPIRSGDLAVTSIDKVRLSNMIYDWKFGPVIIGGHSTLTDESSLRITC
jgi:hypothetical protein